MTNDEKKPRMLWKTVLLFLLLAVIGFGIGFGSAMLVPNSDVGDGFYSIAIYVFSFFIGYLLHFVVHETGHLVFGLLTGYSFVSFRVGNFTLIKQNGKLKTARMGIPGTGGQCLMAPPDYEDGKYPYVLYNLGGIVFNLLGTAAALLAVRDSFPFLVNVLLVGFALAGVYVAVTNALPWKVGGMPTDGYNLLSIKRDAEAKRAFWVQLEANELLAQGMRPKDLPEELFQMENADWTHPLKTSVQILQYNQLLDQKRFKEAEAVLERLVPHMEELIPIYQNEINAERLFLELVGENNPAVIQEIYDEKLIQYIQATRTWPNKLRILMAYEIFQRKDAGKAMEYARSLKEAVAAYPIKGEGEMEVALAEWLESRINQ